MLPTEYTITGKTYNITDGDNTTYWYKTTTGAINNDWSLSGLQYFLNTEHDDNTNKGYLSNIENDAKKMIAETKYYLGVVTSSQSFYIIDIPKEAYLNERAVSGCINNKGPAENTGMYLKFESTPNCKVWKGNSATWTGKIALLYPSDYGYSVSSNNWNTQLKDFNTIKSSSWINLIKSRGYEWFLSPTSGDFDNASDVSTDGTVWDNNVNNKNKVRPTLYLKTNVKITGGTGEQSNP